MITDGPRPDWQSAKHRGVDRLGGFGGDRDTRHRTALNSPQLTKVYLAVAVNEKDFLRMNLEVSWKDYKLLCIVVCFVASIKSIRVHDVQHHLKLLPKEDLHQLQSG